MATLLVTAGPTREYIDDVRFLANASTGRMGYALAAAGAALGHRTILICGPTELDPPAGVEVDRVTSAVEMNDRARARFAEADVAIGAAAVADYRPARRAAGKPARAEAGLTLELVANPDIIAGLGADKGERVVVGFALEAGDEQTALARGREKLARKHLNICVVNRIDAVGAPDSQVTLLFADGRAERLPRQDKGATAAVVVERAVGLLGRGAGESVS